jgi:hypothetical protein
MSGEKKAKKAQVLYCGPSNKSVDVVVGEYPQEIKRSKSSVAQSL